MAKQKLKVILVSEMKNKEGFIQRICKRLNFQHLHTVDLVGIGGGLALLWLKEVSITMLSITEDFIDVMYEDLDRLTPFRATFIHAPASYQQRIHTWR